MTVLTSPDGAVTKSSANGLVGTGFASGFVCTPTYSRFVKAQWVGVRPLHPLLSHLPLTGLLLTTNLLS